MRIDLEREIIEDLTKELVVSDENFSSVLLASKVRNAIREVRAKRNYSATHYTEDQINKDLYNYFSTIRNVALYDYNQIGAEFQTSSSENSNSRSWRSRDELFGEVYAFVQVL